MRPTLGLTATALLVLTAPSLLGAESAGVATAEGGAERMTLIDVPHFDDNDLTIRIDGHLDEDVWSGLQVHDGMRVISPDTLAATNHPTQVAYFHTERGLYVGAKLEQPKETLVARLSGRDRFINRDSFGVTLDTSGEGLYGYWFTVNLGGAVMDGKVAPERRYSNEWDGPWQHGTAELADGWSLEMFLPWSMMAMPQIDGPRRIGFFTNRKVTYLGERWAAPPLPFTSARFMSALGQLQLGDVRPRRQLDFYPYLSATQDEIKGEDHYRAGLDLFWRPTSNFQIAATANPDFGAVESDDVVVNLTAFETFFPEKRLFFLEGNEVFTTTPRSRVRSGSSGSFGRRTRSTYSPTPTTLLNTRRIGGPPGIEVPDGVSAEGAELGRPTDLLGAVKVTGQAGNWRYGLLTAFEEDARRVAERDDGTPIRLTQDGRDFGVARLLYEASGDGRWSAGYIGTLTRRHEYDAVVHGIDAHLLSANGKITWDGQFMASDVDGSTGYGALMNFAYVPTREWRHSFSLDYVDASLDISDLGFIRRNDYRNVLYRAQFSRSRGLTYLRNRRASLLLAHEQNGAGRMVRSAAFLRTGWVFPNSSELRTELDYFPAQWDDRNSFGNGTFKIRDRWTKELALGTDTGKPVSFSILVGLRQESLGGRTYRAAAGVTFKPNDRFSLEFDTEYYRRDGWLLHQEDRRMTTFAATEWRPRLAVDLFLSARQQLRLTLQWAGAQADEQDFWLIPERPGALMPTGKQPGEPSADFTLSRMVGQLRYRWEIGPLSDLFVVYTRGSNLDGRIDAELGAGDANGTGADGFADLFQDAFTNPVVDLLVVKLRYRFGR